MTRTKAILWGALFGGIIGPMLGGLMIAVLDPMTSLSALTLGRLLVAPIVGVVYFGVPGLFLGSAVGIVFRKLTRPSRAMLGAIVALLAYISLLLVLGVFSHGMMPVYVGAMVDMPPSLWFAVGVPGAICGMLFPAPKPSVSPTES